ncbi:acyl-CoA dehydrogenase family protein [Salinibacterium hongtaonis]|uniref:acyl-CoA oxidase n=1 Tax=Homoserinimonas hongtaonis TaxID=2079791 RepID=A0A2U1T1C8_9MICO|nr:acyl-CoA dehydrogenase [Salinibacterium hongtaonis]PWB97583.1 acyl-CoA dehydrogenase [Salinibacterium hongtaonis]
MLDTAPGRTPAAPASPSVEAEVDANLDATSSAASVDVAALGRMLLGTWADIRQQSRDAMEDPQFHRIDNQTKEDHRTRVLGQLQALADSGRVHRAYPVSVGGKGDIGGSIASFTELVFGDPSMQIKAGVQWGLFGSAVQHLGTEYHHKTFLPSIMSLETPGIYAMTETGHGSDVASVGTTATYDETTGEFVIDTPFRGAWKDYLGNAAVHGIDAVVFAQLITKGVNHGVHAFYVPIRSRETGEFLPGVGGEDDGFKGGLNGIDNGRLHFTGVRIPRLNLLNRYGDVAEDGTYSSAIDSPGRRFFTMLGTLVQGRVSLDGAATHGAAMGLAIAITYGNQRRQFEGATGEEMVLLDYQRHQRRLLPRLATTYAQYFAHDEFLVAFDSVFSGKGDTPEAREDLETLAAALKPLSTWHALDTLQEAREACGGAGFLAENRITGLRSDLDIYVTFEGDNTVLLQLVGKRLLGDFAKQFKGADAGKLARYAVGQAAERAFHNTGLRRIAQTVRDFGSTARSVSELRDTEVQRAILTDRVETMVAELAQALRPASKMSPVDAGALFNSQQNKLIEASRAHAELLQWEAFTRGVERVEDPGTKQVLVWLHDIFGLGLIEKNIGWYLSNGRLSPQRAQAVSAYIDRLLTRVRPHAQDLVDAFGFKPIHLRAAIASGAEQQRQDEARNYYEALRASGQAPVHEKTLKAKNKNKKK